MVNEKLIEQLTPAISGNVLEVDNGGKITKFKLLEVSLCQNNVDKHIKSLKEQLNEQKI